MAIISRTQEEAVEAEWEVDEVDPEVVDREAEAEEEEEEEVEEDLEERRGSHDWTGSVTQICKRYSQCSAGIISIQDKISLEPSCLLIWTNTKLNALFHRCHLLFSPFS